MDAGSDQSSELFGDIYESDRMQVGGMRWAGVSVVLLDPLSWRLLIARTSFNCALALSTERQIESVNDWHLTGLECLTGTVAV